MASLELQRAIDAGLIVPLGSFRLDIGGAIVQAYAYKALGPGGIEEIHLEGETPAGTMATRWGDIGVEGKFHIKTDVETFGRIYDAAKRAGAALKIASLLTHMTGGRRPLLAR